MRKLDSDLAEGIMLKAGWKPLEPYKNHRHRWKSECLTCTKISEPTLKNVKKKGTGCSYCKKLKVDEGDAIQFMISAGYLPKTKYVNSKTNWKCECLRCGELVEPTLDRIRSGIGGCKKCGTKDMMDKKRTEQDVAIAIARSRNYEPLEPYLGRHHKWKCKCLKCGQITEPRLSSMQQGAECKNCAKGGFNSYAPAFVYIITHNVMYSIKIGITNDTKQENRIITHKKYGWELYKQFFFKNGYEAQEVEAKLLKWFRKDLNLPIHLSSDLMPQNGHTETVDQDSITVLEIENRIKKLMNDYKVS